MALWHITIAVAVVLILFGVKYWPDLRNAKPEERTRIIGRMGAELVVWIAQGLGAGRIPLAPGTVGSLVGLLWFALLVATGSMWSFALGGLLGLLFAVWCCGKAERILQQKDPGSIVLDEIMAMPFCFLSWLAIISVRTGEWPEPEHFFTGRSWINSAIVFVLFRGFDVLKPWPLRQSQQLPGGWGVVVDDLLAAVLVSLVLLPFLLL